MAQCVIAKNNNFNLLFWNLLHENVELNYSTDAFKLEAPLSVTSPQFTTLLSQQTMYFIYYIH